MKINNSKIEMRCERENQQNLKERQIIRRLNLGLFDMKNNFFKQWNYSRGLKIQLQFRASQRQTFLDWSGANSKPWEQILKTRRPAQFNVKLTFSPKSRWRWCTFSKITTISTHRVKQGCPLDIFEDMKISGMERPIWKMRKELKETTYISTEYMDRSIPSICDELRTW